MFFELSSLHDTRHDTFVSLKRLDSNKDLRNTMETLINPWQVSRSVKNASDIILGSEATMLTKILSIFEKSES